MSAPGRKKWIGAAMLAGVLYSAIGVVFALPPSHVRAWRLAAWAASAAVFAAHIWREHSRPGSTPRAAASHAALAVAVGAFGLAVAANVHELWAAAGYRRALALALVAWPALAALPAFVVALVAAYGLALARRRD